jgi:hypothetical protein
MTGMYQGFISLRKKIFQIGPFPDENTRLSSELQTSKTVRPILPITCRNKAITNQVQFLRKLHSPSIRVVVEE